MRDPNRLYDFYDKLMTCHIEHFPDWRFGQLVHNLETWLYNKKAIGDMFYIEEQPMLRYLNEFIDDMKARR